MEVTFRIDNRATDTWGNYFSSQIDSYNPLPHTVIKTKPKKEKKCGCDCCPHPTPHPTPHPGVTPPTAPWMALQKNEWSHFGPEPCPCPCCRPTEEEIKKKEQDQEIIVNLEDNTNNWDDEVDADQIVG